MQWSVVAYKQQTKNAELAQRLAAKFKIRASQAAAIMGSTVGLSDKEKSDLKTYEDKIKNFKSLTDTQQAYVDKYSESEKITEKQKEKLDSYLEKARTAKPLTDKQRERYNTILEKRKRGPELPQGAKTYVETWLKERIYGKRKEFTSKYTDKGNLVEKDALKFLVQQMGWGFANINTKYFEDEFMCGTPDVILKPLIPDIKNSFDCFSFPLFKLKLDAIYFWQGMVYMHILKRKKFNVCYCLMNMPQSIIEKEAKKMSYYDEYKDTDISEIIETLTEKYSYDHLPDELRLKVFEFDYDERAIERLQTRVQMCRNYILELIEKHKLPLYHLEEKLAA